MELFVCLFARLFYFFGVGWGFGDKTNTVTPEHKKSLHYLSWNGAAERIRLRSTSRYLLTILRKKPGEKGRLELDETKRV